MRSYLLGTLEADSAEVIEERYFTDRNFFLFMQEAETALIQDYLANRLAPLPRRLFEQRYLAVPELRRRLDEVRAGNETTTTPEVANLNTRMILAAAIVLICICGLSLWMYRSRMILEPLPGVRLDRPVLATIALSPGVTKAGTDQMVRVRQTSESGDVRLLLDVPGGVAPRMCFARLSVFSSDGARKKVWSASKPVWPIKVPGGQRATLLVNAALLVPDDYLVELLGPDDQVRESYLFRVTPR